MSSNRGMVYWRASLLLPAFLVGGAAFGQIIGYPGGYPGGYPYPGVGIPLPMPGGHRKNTDTTDTGPDRNSVTTLNGILRRISKTELVIEADDKRILSVALNGKTKYFRDSGSAKTKDFQPGDHVNIDATQDDSGFYQAKNVTQVKVGTPEERAAASQPVDVSPVADNSGGKLNDRTSKSDDSNGGGSVPGDDDRPRLHRGNSSGSDNSNNAGIRPQITDGDSNDSQPASNGRRAPRGESNAPAAPDPSDPGPPVLRRGAPQQSASSSRGDSYPEPSVAENNPPASSRPSIHAEEVNGVTRTPDAPSVGASSGDGGRDGRPGVQRSGDSVIDDAREEAFAFSETLPNYVVKQFTTRFQSEAANGGHTSWQALDTVSVDVTSEGGKESYKNILANGKPPKEAVEKTGSWSTGEYATVLQDVLSTGTAAHFFNKRTTTLVNRNAYRYDFSVEKPNSHWHVYASAESYIPGYRGAIWIDKETSRVLRIEMEALNMPTAFPLDTVESAVDYDFVRIGDDKFLLPVHSEALTCERGTSICSRNVIDFRNYKKFGADSSITFDTNK